MLALGPPSTLRHDKLHEYTDICFCNLFLGSGDLKTDIFVESSKSNSRSFYHL